MTDYHGQYYQNQVPDYPETRNEAVAEIVIRGSDDIIIARANVELYNAVYGGRNWNLIDAGIIYLMQNKQNYYLVLVTLDSDQQPVWKREINRNVAYKIDKPYFHVVFVKDKLYGINFADLTEAEMFFYAIERLWPFKNISKMISKFTTRFVNFFARKKIPPMPIHLRNQRRSARQNDLDVNQFYRDDELPNNRKHDKHVHFEFNDDNDTFHHFQDHEYYRSNSTRVPKPPPLPPPVQNFNFTSNRMMNPRCANENFNNMNSDSFEEQIKHEAKRRHKVPSFFKYLP